MLKLRLQGTDLGEGLGLAVQSQPEGAIVWDRLQIGGVFRRSLEVKHYY